MASEERTVLMDMPIQGRCRAGNLDRLRLRGLVAFWRLSGDIRAGLARIESETVVDLNILVSA